MCILWCSEVSHIRGFPFIIGISGNRRG